MSRIDRAELSGPNGLRGTVDHSTRIDRDGEDHYEVRLEDGRRLVVPAELLILQKDGSFYLPLGADDLECLGEVRDESTTVSPVVEEVVEVEKRLVESGRVRVSKIVREREEIVDEPLLREEVEVERVAVNRIVEGAAPVRHEDDVMIVPVYEEVLVVEKRLMLKEELRIRKHRVPHSHQQRVTLKTEEVSVERIEG